MSAEDLMMCINQRSTSFFDSIVATTGGRMSSICFRDIVRCGVGTIKSSFDQELVMMIYLDQGDKKLVKKQLLNMVYMEIPDNEELVRKVLKLKKTTLFPTFFKGTRRLDDMLHKCAELALNCAMIKTKVPSRKAGIFVGCGKDMYITHFQEIVDIVTNDLVNRLHRSERKIIKSIYGNS